MPIFTLTIRGSGLRTAIKHYDLPSVRHAKVRAFQIGAEVAETASTKSGQNWRIELAENGKVLLAYTVQAETADSQPNGHHGHHAANEPSPD